MAITDNKRGVRIGLGRRINYPTQLPNLATWYTAGDVSSMLNNAGTTPVSGDTIKLLGDKSGNSSVNVLALNGVPGNYASSSNAAPVQITGSIQVDAGLTASMWTTTSTSAIFAAKDSGAGQRSWLFWLETDAKLYFRYSTDGTTVRTATSTVIVPFANHALGYVRVTYDSATGDVMFYTSTDDVTYTQLGTTVVLTAGAMFNSTARITVGQQDGGTSTGMIGNFRFVRVYNGIAGTLAWNPVFTGVAKLATSFTESSSNAATVTINTTGDTGARICGARDAVQMTVSAQPVYLAHSGTNYGYLNGVSGNYYSAPDSVPLSITGDIDVRAYLALDDWTAAGEQEIVAKRQSAGQISYVLRVQATTGKLVFYWSADGTSAVATVVSTVAPTVSDFGSLWIRATLDVDNGAVGNDVKFYTSPDGSTWTQLGTTVTTAGVTSIFDSTSVLEIGSVLGGTANRVTGNIYRAQIYNGIAGTLAFDFNPSAYVSGTTFLDSSSNAATITLNGGSTIVTRTCLYFDGSNDYLKCATFSLSQPATILGVFNQTTWTQFNCIYSGDTSSTINLRQDSISPRVASYAGSVTIENDNLALATNGIITAVFNAGSSLLRINRGSLAGPSNIGTAAVNGFTLGARGDPFRFSNITASEIIIYSSAQDQNNQNLIIGYLAMVWKILLGN